MQYSVAESMLSESVKTISPNPLERTDMEINKSFSIGNNYSP